MIKLVALFVVGIACALISAHAHSEMPKDVRRFFEKNDLCNHFAGEISGEPNLYPEREKAVIQKTNKYCANIDKQHAALKRRYRNNAIVSAKLMEYKAIIEQREK
jgi:hypothetical protein